ncbi:uncharacterized protein (DUF1697 family) [Nakamurella sp. UYEF19]|uniref:DUF1697 domain-containing protein n=1 Tax=Nakamurella sp. UYEF19 TaxID=1756392 RepID=UPI003393F2DF
MTATTYVALLKGINVGKAKRIAMADLRALLAGLGYDDVATLLQSGNAVFTASATAPKVTAAIEKGLLDECGLDVAVVVRTEAQLAAAVAADPFTDLADDPSKHLLGFLSGVPEASKLTAFDDLVTSKNVDPDVGGVYRIEKDHCYLWCPQGVSKSSFAMVDWDRKLGVTVTMRNFATIGKLLDMTKV